MGIVIGIAFGLLMLRNLPVGVQPGDTLIATYGNESQAEITIPEGEGPLTPVFVKNLDPKNKLEPKFTKPLDIAGESFENLPTTLNTGSNEFFYAVQLKERKEVTVRPWPTEVIYVIGQVFLRLLKMLVIPLIIATVLIGIASLSDIKKLGRLGGAAAAWYIASMLVAVTIGVTLVNIIKPGKGLHFPGAEAAATTASASQLILKTIPTNPFQAIANMDVVGILFFVILMALAMLQMGKRRVAPVYNFFEGLNDIVYVIVGWVMKMAPFGVGALIAHTIGTQDVAFLGTLLSSLAWFAVTVTGGLLIHFIVLQIAVSALAKYSPFQFMKHMGPAFATAFGTNSSSATLPVTMKCVDKMNVSKRISNFVLPVGATLNMDGTALFEAVAVLFFAQAFGMGLGVPGQIIVAITSVVAAVGAAGIPSAGLVTMTIVLSAAGVPTSKMQILWAIDRPLDMMRTVVNITGDAVVARVLQTRFPEIRPEEDEMAEAYEEVLPDASHD
ncbi:MAG TPA: dicarboxylate/amino acid:cation symporter [Fimbriimonadaceae bacterium]|nr:dicarboxylate/amino acid:cation symporter [Fimbriimonadaceae bacterium]